MININVKSTVLPVKIGELEFAFDMSDQGLKNLEDKHESVVKKLQLMKQSDLQDPKLIIEECLELFLGKGTFDKVYEQTPSVIMCMEILINLTEMLGESIQKNLPQSEKFAKYLKKSKK